MENPNADQSLFNLRVNDNLRVHLRNAAAVANIAAILFLCTAVLRVVLSFVGRNKTVLEKRYEGFNQTSVAAERTGNIAGSVIWLVISILLFYFLNKFARQTKAALNANDQQTLNDGLSGLSAYMVTVGILLIIFFALVMLAMMVLMSAGTQ